MRELIGGESHSFEVDSWRPKLSATGTVEEPTRARLSRAAWVIDFRGRARGRGIETANKTRPKGRVTVSVDWWSRTGSNRRPPECHSGALPTELRPQSEGFGALTHLEADCFPPWDADCSRELPGKPDERCGVSRTRMTPPRPASGPTLLAASWFALRRSRCLSINSATPESAKLRRTSRSLASCLKSFLPRPLAGREESRDVRRYPDRICQPG